MIIYNVSEGQHRTVATHTCDEMFQLLGDEIRTCEDGVWAEASPLQYAQEGVFTLLRFNTSNNAIQHVHYSDSPIFFCSV